MKGGQRLGIRMEEEIRKLLATTAKCPDFGLIYPDFALSIRRAGKYICNQHFWNLEAHIEPLCALMLSTIIWQEFIIDVESRGILTHPPSWASFGLLQSHSPWETLCSLNLSIVSSFYNLSPPLVIFFSCLLQWPGFLAWSGEDLGWKCFRRERDHPDLTISPAGSLGNKLASAWGCFWQPLKQGQASSIKTPFH